MLRHSLCLMSTIDLIITRHEQKEANPPGDGFFQGSDLDRKIPLTPALLQGKAALFANYGHCIN